MQCLHLHSSKKPIHSGSALVGLLVVAGLVIVVFLTHLYIKKTAKDPDTCLDLKPWEEWRLRKSNDKPTEGPSEEQPDITEGLRYNVSVGYQDESRGEIKGLVINPDGSVNGTWTGYYWKSKLNYDVQGGDFEGFVCPLKIYKDEDGEDPSKLYFIAKGGFLIHESDLKDKYRVRMGDLYVTGWIEADYVAHGELIITSDEKYSETYEWKAYSLVKK